MRQPFSLRLWVLRWLNGLGTSTVLYCICWLCCSLVSCGKFVCNFWQCIEGPACLLSGVRCRLSICPLFSIGTLGPGPPGVLHVRGMSILVTCCTARDHCIFVACAWCFCRACTWSVDGLRQLVFYICGTLGQGLVQCLRPVLIRGERRPVWHSPSSKTPFGASVKVSLVDFHCLACSSPFWGVSWSPRWGHAIWPSQVAAAWAMTSKSCDWDLRKIAKISPKWPKTASSVLFRFSRKLSMRFDFNLFFIILICFWLLYRTCGNACQVKNRIRLKCGAADVTVWCCYIWYCIPNCNALMFLCF